VVLLGAVQRACGMHLSLLAVRRLSLFSASDHFRERRERSHHGDRNRSRAPTQSALSSAISTAIVQWMRQYTGRGPMKAQTTIRASVVLVMLAQTLTKGEQVLVEKGAR
jgi:hypothetical protein